VKVFKGHGQGMEQFYKNFPVKENILFSCIFNFLSLVDLRMLVPAKRCMSCRFPCAKFVSICMCAADDDKGKVLLGPSAFFKLHICFRLHSLPTPPVMRPPTRAVLPRNPAIASTRGIIHYFPLSRP
jgi:hypothetical protein